LLFIPIDLIQLGFHAAIQQMIVASGDQLAASSSGGREKESA
jgi:hypothetical protein